MEQTQPQRPVFIRLGALVLGAAHIVLADFRFQDTVAIQLSNGRHETFTDEQDIAELKSFFGGETLDPQPGLALELDPNFLYRNPAMGGSAAVEISNEQPKV